MQSISADFGDAHPLATTSMLLFDRVVGLVDEGFDSAVRISHLPDSSLVWSHVGDVHRILVASADYLARRGTLKRPADLKIRSIIGHTVLMANREWRYVDSGKPARLTLKPRMEVNDAQAGIHLAHHGKRITIALSYMVVDALRAGRVATVLGDYSPQPVPVHVIYAQRRIIAPKVRAFFDFAAPRLRAALADLGDEPRRAGRTNKYRR